MRPARARRGLARTLAVKIVLTAVLWGMPLLLLPESLMHRLGLPATVPTMFYRLLGTAYTALLVEYLYGLHALRSGGYPAGTVRVGLVSNIAACLVLYQAWYGGVWDTWPFTARALMMVSLFATGGSVSWCLVPSQRADARADTPHSQHFCYRKRRTYNLPQPRRREFRTSLRRFPHLQDRRSD